jgi:hypothetical protein
MSPPAPSAVFEYASKAVAASAPSGPDFVVAGTLNIRNAATVAARITKQIAIPGVGTSKVFTEELAPGGATRITSRQVVENFGLTLTGGVEGFLVIRSPVSLDVVAVYTAGPRGGAVTAIDVVHVPERRLVEE